MYRTEARAHFYTPFGVLCGTKLGSPKGRAKSVITYKKGEYQNDTRLLTVLRIPAESPGALFVIKNGIFENLAEGFCTAVRTMV